MTDTTSQAVVETPAPDANVETKVETSPDSSPGAVDTSEKAKPKKDGAQQRIDELTWHRRNLERDRNYWRDLALSKQQQAAAAETKQPEAKGLKKLADFDFDEERYQEYVADVAAEKAAAKLRAQQEAEKTESSRKSNQSKFREREAALKGEIDDYEDVAYTAPIHDHVADLVMSMDEGPRIAYYLGKNPETAARLSALPPLEAAKELGRIETRLAYEREQAKAKPVSKAPPPPPKIDATEPAVDKDPTQMTDKEFAKWRKTFMNKR